MAVSSPVATLTAKDFTLEITFALQADDPSSYTVTRTPDGRAHFVVTPIPARLASPLTLATVRSEGQFNTIIYERKDSYRAGADRWSVRGRSGALG